MTAKIFIDGEHGTTGLQIRERLTQRVDLKLLSLDEADRRDRDKRTALLREAEIAVLCLPDDAAREAVALAGDAGTRFIDASTAHRTDPDWVFGFAELEPGQADRIAQARHVSNPGCYSTGAIALLRPLLAAGLLPPDYPVTINAVSGYSGGGKQLIAKMEDAGADDHIAAPHFAYATGLRHKHVPEIMARAGLDRTPIFTPSVGRFAQGMAVSIPLHLDLMNGAPALEAIHESLTAHYAGQEIVTVRPLAEAADGARIDPTELVGRDTMNLYVTGTKGDGRANLIATLDNLGKGASGAAVQNLNLMIGAADQRAVAAA